MTQQQIKDKLLTYGVPNEVYGIIRRDLPETGMCWSQKFDGPEPIEKAQYVFCRGEMPAVQQCVGWEIKRWYFEEPGIDGYVVVIMLMEWEGAQDFIAIIPEHYINLLNQYEAESLNETPQV